MVTVSDGKSKPIPMRLNLSMEVLKLQREDLEVEFDVITFLCSVRVALWIISYVGL